MEYSKDIFQLNRFVYFQIKDIHNKIQFSYTYNC